MCKQIPINHQQAPPTPESILASPVASYWLKDALTSALGRDPVDAVMDAELLAAVLADRTAALLHGGSLG